MNYWANIDFHCPQFLVCMSKIANLVDLWTMEALNPKGMGFEIFVIKIANFDLQGSK